MPVIRLAKPSPKSPARLQAEAFADWCRENLVVPSGLRQGQPFELEPFQLDFVTDLLAREADGPTYRIAALSTPRKNGKIALVAALVLGFMTPGSPIYHKGWQGAISAPSENHARLVPQAVMELQEASGLSAVQFIRHPSPGHLRGPEGQKLVILTGTKTQGHGHSIDMGFVDEAGLLPRSAEVVTNLLDAVSARDGQLLLLGTRGDAPAFNDILERPDKRTAVHLHSADLDDDPSDPKVWAKANPGLGTIKSPRYMEDAFERAQASCEMNAYRAWNLNMRLDPARELLLEYSLLSGAYDEDATWNEGEPVFVGLDLGGSASMTAAVAVGAESGVIRCLGAFPTEPLSLIERGKRDMIGDAWANCANRGELIETSGKVTDLAEFFATLREWIGPHEVLSVSTDRYRQAEAETALARAGIAWPLIFRGTGPKDGDNDIRACRRLFMSGKAKLRRSLLLEVSLSEADTKVSTTGAMQLDKSHRNARIDVASALVLACAAWIAAKDAPRPEFEMEVIG